MKNTAKSNPMFFSPDAQRERSRLYHKYAPKFQGSDFVENFELGAYIFRFNYKTDGYKSSFYFPILKPLPEITFTPAVADLKPGNSFFSFFNRLNKLPILASLGVAAIVGFYKAAVDLNKYKIGAVGYSATGLFGRIAVMSMSLSYLTIAIFAFVVLPILRNRLAAYFDHTEHDLHCKLPWYIPHSGIKHYIRLPFLYSIILSEYFPGVRDLKWRFYYLDARCWREWSNRGSSVEDSRYNLALKYCDTQDQKFFTLKQMINSAKLWVTRMNYKVDYEDNIKSCVVQISSDSNEHRELGASLRMRLQDCLNTLVIEKNEQDAILKFNAIDFDAYSQEAYPGATILYYQLDAVLTLLGRNNPILEQRNPCDGSRLCSIDHSHCIVRQNVDKYYKHLSSLMYEFAYSFVEFKKDLPSEIKPKPGLPINKFVEHNKHFKILSIDADSEPSIDSEPDVVAPTQRLICF